MDGSAEPARGGYTYYLNELSGVSNYRMMPACLEQLASMYGNEWTAYLLDARVFSNPDR